MKNAPTFRQVISTSMGQRTKDHDLTKLLMEILTLFCSIYALQWHQELTWKMR